MSQNMRKEPTFGETGNSETAKQMSLNLQASSHQNQAPSFTFTPVENPQPTTDVPDAKVEAATAAAESAPKTDSAPQPNVTAERVVPPAGGNWRKPEEWKALNKVPSKHRRLVVVILIALCIPLFLWLLKPSEPETTVNDLQQNNNVPIEFRPVNEEEAKRLEEEARLRAEQEAAQQAAQAQAQAQAQIQPVQPVQPQPVAQPQEPAAQNEQNNAQTTPAVTPQPVKVEPETPVAAPKPQMPKSNQSVIHQTETVVKEKPQPKPAKPVVEKKPETSTPKAVNKEKQLDNLIKEVNKPTAASAATTGSGGKTLTVPKGVSLMQVFRDNQLNISDVNAMSKASGANNVLSSFKPGDKVSVRLDKNNRVTEMSLSSGGKFVRQADGSYTFSK